MSVSNGKRYAAEPACHVIKAGGLYVRGVAGSGAVTELYGLTIYALKIPGVVL